MRSFRMIAMVYAAFCIAIGIFWFMDVALYAATYGVDVGTKANFFGQRVAPVVIGLGILIVMAILAICAPLIANDPLKLTPIKRLKPPSEEFLFGTDFLGREALEARGVAVAQEAAQPEQDT